MVFARMNVSSLFTARSIVSPKQGEGGDCDGHFEVPGTAVLGPDAWPV